MKLEHFALQVPDPVAMAEWYVKHLGCTIVRSDEGSPYGRFLNVGGALFEIYRNPKASIPDYKAVEPLHLHVAFISENLVADRDRLVKAGAKVVGDVAMTPGGDEIMMLRDPWDLPLQFVKRKERMI